MDEEYEGEAPPGQEPEGLQDLADDEPTGPSQDEETSTSVTNVPADEPQAAPGVTGSYTEEGVDGAGGEAGGTADADAEPVQGLGSAAGSRPASGASAQPAASQAGSRPASAQGAEPHPGSRPASAQAAASQAGFRPASAQPAESQPGSRPASAQPAEPQPGSRPASTQPAQPQPGSRPASGSAAPPAPAEPAARTPSRLSGSTTPAQPAPIGSRGGSPSAPSSTPPSLSSNHAAPAPPQLSVLGSRPGSGTPPPTAPPPPTGSCPPSSNAAPTQPSSPIPPPTSQPGRPPSGGAGAADAATAAKQAQMAAAQAAGHVQPGVRTVDVDVTQGPGLPHAMLSATLDMSQMDSKRYMGGFKSKRTGAIYHHATTQTPRALKYAGVEPKIERTTQTVKVKTRTQQSVREAATQMERPGVLIDTTHDTYKTGGRYQTSEERLAIVTAATRTIQRWVRGWLGRKRAAVLRAKKMEREAFLVDEELRAQRAAEEHRRKEIERRMHPRTVSDFEILYNELEAWRLQETRKIKEAGLPKDKEQEVLQQLLHKETKLLQTIDRLKINANHENKDLRVQHTLGEMSKPIRYELKNGGKVNAHTPFTTRAKELMQLYNGLNLPQLSIDERLDVLLHVKWTVKIHLLSRLGLQLKEFDCPLTREIVELIDREADLLNRGRNPKMLEGLRKRVSSLFLNFVETPEFNPQSSKFQVVPMDFESYLFNKIERATAKQLVVTTGTDKWAM